jgi:hypothetical protein
MPKNVQMPDGKIVEFPDNMSDAEVSNAIRTSSRPQITQPKPTLNKVMAPGEFGNGFIHTIPDMMRHPIDTAAKMGEPFVSTGMAPGGMYPTTAPAGGQLRQNLPIQLEAQQGQKETTNAIKENPAYAAGGIASQLAAAGALKGIGRVAPVAGEAIRSAAIGDPDAALLRGLRVTPGSKRGIPTVQAGEGARPFLQGVRTQAELQAKAGIGGSARNEVWGPYKKTIDAIGNKQVQGPDGPTTVQALEDERGQLSADLRTLRKGGPEAEQLAKQKGKTQAEVIQREKQVQQALDPHLEEAGVDPKLIRKTFGQVARIGDTVAGRTTAAEPKEAFGFSKLKDVSLTKPLSNIPLAGSIARDVAAGRYLSANPTDVAIREAFRTAGPKPDFRAPASAMPNVTPPRQLPASTSTNAQFRMGGGPTTLEATEGQNGIPHFERTIRTGQAPPAQAALPATAGGGETQPMIRYGRPYVEPPESTSIRTMPPQPHLQLPAMASRGETRPYIAYRPAPAPGETTRIIPTRPQRLEMQGQPLPSSGSIRGLLPAPDVPAPSPEPTTAHIYPAGSAFRGQPMETPVYPPGSAFRQKIAPFDIDAYLRGQQ